MDTSKSLVTPSEPPCRQRRGNPARSGSERLDIMLLIPTIIQESTIHGLGVFASRYIQFGETVWIFDIRVDFRRAEFPEFLKPFVFRDSEGMGMDGDNARFMNHSLTPNLISAESNKLIANCLINFGDELTVDYNNPESLCEINPTSKPERE